MQPTFCFDSLKPGRDSKSKGVSKANHEKYMKQKWTVLMRKLHNLDFSIIQVVCKENKVQATL